MRKFISAEQISGFLHFALLAMVGAATLDVALHLAAHLIQV